MLRAIVLAPLVALHIGCGTSTPVKEDVGDARPDVAAEDTPRGDAAPDAASDAAPDAADDDEQRRAAGREYFTDAELRNQRGEVVRFYTDLIQGRAVVIHPFFTTCATTCPPATAQLAKIAKGFGDRMGEEVSFVSITLDPTVDTPERLAEFGRKYGAGDGWTFVTGEAEAVTGVLEKLGQYTPNKEDHPTVLLVGNDRTGVWKKAFALGDPDELMATVRSVVDDPG